MKKLSYSLFALLVFSILSTSAFADTLSIEKTKELKTKIEQYVNTTDHSNTDGSATIYTHFLIKEEGVIYTVDFMLTSDGKITILSKDTEEEFYRVEFFNAKFVEKYSVNVPTIVT